MNKQTKLVLLVTFLLGMVPAWGQTPSTDFWVTFSVNGNTTIIEKNSFSPDTFCVDSEIEMILHNEDENIEYESIMWEFGDGTSYNPSFGASQDEMVKTKNTYHSHGWFDLNITAAYIDSNTGTKHNESFKFSFLVVKAETLQLAPEKICITLEEQEADPSQKALAGKTFYDQLPQEHCYDTIKIQPTYYGIVTQKYTWLNNQKPLRDSIEWPKNSGRWYKDEPDVDIQLAPDTLVGVNHWGCDSIVIYQLRVRNTLQFAIKADSIHSCAGDTVELPCSYTKGEFGKVWMENLADNKKYPIPANFLPNAEQDNVILLPTKDFKPGRYQMRIYAIDAVFNDTLPYSDLTIDVYYPSDIFQFKFNNVLAVYKPGYGGNTNLKANFIAYQWYIDGKPVEGAVESEYYNGELNPFKENTEVYVVLTTVVNGDTLTLPSCSQTLTDIPNYNKDAKDNANMVPAQKMLLNQHMFIRKGNEQYNIYGQKVK